MSCTIKYSLEASFLCDGCGASGPTISLSDSGLDLKLDPDALFGQATDEARDLVVVDGWLDPTESLGDQSFCSHCAPTRPRGTACQLCGFQVPAGESLSGWRIATISGEQVDYCSGCAPDAELHSRFVLENATEDIWMEAYREANEAMLADPFLYAQAAVSAVWLEWKDWNG